MDLLASITNNYERKARLYPALLLISPIIAVGAALFSDRLTGFQFALAGAVSFGGVFLLIQLARDFGNKKEKELFAKWGGVPSITIFRHQDARLDSVTKERYHKKLERLVKEAKAPNSEEENNDPRAADKIYSAWSNFLRANTRDPNTFGLLLQENINYGYRRNVFGFRAIGIFLTVITVLTSAIRLYLVYRSSSQVDQPLLAAGLFSLLMLALWIFRFTSEWVRTSADAYAERLAESVEILSERSSSKK